jgi:hypothetical protein
MKTAMAPESGASNTSMTTAAATSPCLPALKSRGEHVTISTRSNLDGRACFDFCLGPGVWRMALCRRVRPTSRRLKGIPPVHTLSFGTDGSARC